MSEPIGCCYRNSAPYLNETVHTYHWVEIALLIGATLFLFFAALTLSQSVTFAQMSYAYPLALGCFVIAALLFILELVYKAIFYCKIKSLPIEILTPRRDFLFQNNKKRKSTVFLIDQKADISPYINTAHTYSKIGVASSCNENLHQNLTVDSHYISTLLLQNNAPLMLVSVFDQSCKWIDREETLEREFFHFIENELSKALKSDEETIFSIFEKTSHELVFKEMNFSYCCIASDFIYSLNRGNTRTLLLREEKFIQLHKDLLPPPQITPTFRLLRKNTVDNFEEGVLGYHKGAYLILATHGLWEVATNEEVYKTLEHMRSHSCSLSEMAGRYVDAAIKAGCKDNISIVVVKL